MESAAHQHGRGFGIHVQPLRPHVGRTSSHIVPAGPGKWGSPGAESPHRTDISRGLHRPDGAGDRLYLLTHHHRIDTVPVQRHRHPKPEGVQSISRIHHPAAGIVRSALRHCLGPVRQRQDRHPHGLRRLSQCPRRQHQRRRRAGIQLHADRAVHRRKFLYHGKLCHEPGECKRRLAERQQDPADLPLYPRGAAGRWLAYGARRGLRGMGQSFPERELELRRPSFRDAIPAAEPGPHFAGQAVSRRLPGSDTGLFRHQHLGASHRSIIASSMESSSRGRTHFPAAPAAAGSSSSRRTCAARGTRSWGARYSTSSTFTRSPKVRI